MEDYAQVRLSAVSGSVADAVGRNCPFCGEPCVECSHKAQKESSKSVVMRCAKRVTGYVAMNEGEFDIENMSFYEKLRDAKKKWGSSQKYMKVEICFEHIT
jgi:hypothetical protein